MKFSKLTDRISELGSDKWVLHLEARKLKKNNSDIIELTIGEPDQPPSKKLIEKCYESMKAGRTKYSNGRGEDILLDALVKKYQKRTSSKVSRNNFLCLPGTQTALFASIMTLVEEKDTADVAKTILKNKIKNSAAIASVEAAHIYGLDIIFSNIQTIKNNETRFVIISKDLSKNENLNDKASLKFSLSHETGSLASVLSILKNYNLNLTKIQSLPIVEIPWKYSFFIDTTFRNINDFNKAFELINEKAESLKLLGIYKNQMK